MLTPQLQTSRHFEFDTPWSMGFLITACAFCLVWIVWQLMREGRVSQLRWGFFFLLLRMTVAGVLTWMILGPTTVLTQKETFPRTLAVYVDTSSSMQIQDQPEHLSDRRWQMAADYQEHSLTAADRVVFFASALKRQTARLVDSIEQQASPEERQEIATNWQRLAKKCDEWLESAPLKQGLPPEQQVLYQQLRQLLGTELRPMLAESAWITGSDPGDRDQRLQRLTQHIDQFIVRCQILAEALAQASLDVVSTSHPTDVPTRLQRVTPALKQGLSEWLKAGNNFFRVQLSQFSQHVTPLPLDNWEPLLNGNESPLTDSRVVRGTDLADLLKQIRDDAGKEEIAAAVILTDGRHTVQSPDDPRDLVSQLRLPVYFVPIGHGERKRDVILHHIHAPTSVIQKDKILIEGIVTAHRCLGESCEIHLIESDKVVQSKTVSFKTDQDDQRFRFEIPTEISGRRVFTVVVEKLDDENSTENNSRSVAVEVADAELRILLADGQSRWEYQYLVNLFNRQDKVELDQLKFAPHAVGTGRRKKSHQFPETVQEWSDYRVVILGDVSPRQFSQQSQEALREYITQRGGSLIIIAGQNSMPQAFAREPLEQLLPVEVDPRFSPDPQGYRVELTAEGRTADAMLLVEDLPSTEEIWRQSCASLPIYFLSNYHKPKPNSQVLLNAVASGGTSSKWDSPAFLCWQTVGAGRVAYFSSPTTYHLRNRNGDKYHHRFWGQMVRWIISRSMFTGSKSVKLLADKSHYDNGDAAQLTVELTDAEGHPVVNATPEVDVIKSGDVISNISLVADPKVPGRYLGSFATNDADKYALRARGPDVERLLKAEKYVDPVQIQIAFESGLDRELIDPRADRPLMEHLAEQTGGTVLEPTALAELTHAVSLQPRVVETSQKTPLWNRWWCLWVMLGCLTVEWLIRKQVGLA